MDQFKRVEKISLISSQPRFILDHEKKKSAGVSKSIKFEKDGTIKLKRRF